MNLTNLLHAFGLGDGQGNISSMRIVFMLLVLAVIVPKVVLAIKSGVPPTWVEGDFAVLAIAFGGKTIQNVQEKPSSAPPTPAPAENPPVPGK